jgi:DeoR/GlpR family transcriptional regulator of sugar metabolism
MISLESERELMPTDGQPGVRERRQAILGLILDRDSVTVRELVERFGVSNMTVHRDLDALEERGVLRKMRGRATAQPSAAYESSLAFRLGENREEKERIARVAAQLVEPGSTLLLDDSTTGLAMLPHLERIPELTVVTTFASIVDEVARMTEGTLNLIVIGGTYNAKYHAFGGVMAQEALRNLRVDRCFMASLVDVKRGAFHREPDQAALKRTMIQIAETSTLLADYSKFSKRGMHRVAELSAFDTVVVDDRTEPAIVRELRAGGRDVKVAGPHTTGPHHPGPRPAGPTG